MVFPDDLTIAILAGGQSTRFGRDKALADFEGRPLLAHVLARVAGLGAETLVVANHPEVYAPFAPRVVADLQPGCGPLGGLYTALHYATRPWVLCLACDMPLINPALLKYLLTLVSDKIDAVVPCPAQRPEPLHAIFSRECQRAVQAALERSERRIISFFPEVRVRYVTDDEMQPYDPEQLSFMNINSPGQLAEAARHLSAP